MSVQSRTDMEMVVEYVEEKINNNEPFTAYDITLAIREELQPLGGWIQHYKVKPIVHGIFHNNEMGGYTRSNITTPGGDAWLYHELSYDPWDYIEEEFGYDRPTFSNSYDDDYDGLSWDLDVDDEEEIDLEADDLDLEDDMENSLGNELFDDEDEEEVDDDYFLVDSGGRVCIPKEDAEYIDCYPGDFVEAGFCPANYLMITKCHYHADATHTVDVSGNIRIRVNVYDIGERYRVLQIKRPNNLGNYLRVEFKEE